MNQYIVALIAGAAAVSMEWCYKQQWAIDGGWSKFIWLWIPPSLLISWCIYQMVNSSGANLLDAFILWALATAILRIFVACCILHQTLPIQSWIGFGLVLSATLVKTLWTKT